MDVLSVELPLGPTVGEGGGPLSRECYNMRQLSMTFLKCFDCVDLNVSQKLSLKEKGQSATKSQPCTRQVLARIGAAAATRTLSSMLSHWMFVDFLQQSRNPCDSKCAAFFRMFLCLSGTSGTVQPLTQDRFGRFVVKRIKKEEDKKA